MEARKQGICNYCFKVPTEKGFRRCSECRGKEAEAQARQRKKRESFGLCPQCGAKFYNEGKKYCQRSLNCRKGSHGAY